MTVDEVPLHLAQHREQRVPLTPTIFPPTQPDTSTPIRKRRPRKSPTSPSSSEASVASEASTPSDSPPSSPLSLVIDTTQDHPTTPDSDHPISPVAPSPEFLSQIPDTARIIQRFLEAFDNSDPEPTSSQHLPTSPPPTSPTTNSLPLFGNDSFRDFLNSPLTTNLLPAASPPTPTTTPSPAIPPLMAIIVPSPNKSTPSTRQPSHRTRPTAEDFFEPPATHPLQPVIDTLAEPVQNRPYPRPNSDSNPRQPTLETLDDLDSHQPNPPRPNPRDQQCPIPLLEDPSTQTFPSSQTSTSLHDFRERWTLEFGEEMDWHDFGSLTREFATKGLELAMEIQSQQRPRPAKRRPDRPSARPPIDYRRPNTVDPSAARRLQHLYRVSKKRAARTVLGDDSPGFDGTLEDATNYFTASFGPRACDTNHLLEELKSFVPSADMDESLYDPPSPEELSAKLRACANSAPGKDRLEYRHLRLLDPKCTILARMYHHCFAKRDVPTEWKSATTILIHKKDATNDASNFRPIALMSCLYKLLMAILARRMTTCAIANDLLSPEQKSARPSEGCYEHAFLLESVVNDARRQPRHLYLAWLDIRNAFGSIPHAALLTTLTHMGFPKPLVDMIGNVYTGASTEVLTPLGKTPSIPYTRV